MQVEFDDEKALVHDACLELEHDPCITPDEAVEIARKHPGRWWGGNDGRVKAAPQKA